MVGTVNWQRYRDQAKRSIDKWGRPLTLINAQGAEDPDDPLGKSSDPIIVPDIMGVFVRPSGYIKLGESFYTELGMWEEAEKIALVLPSLTHDFSKFTGVKDEDGLSYKIFKVEELKPGPVPILLYLGLKT